MSSVLNLKIDKAKIRRVCFNYQIDKGFKKLMIIYFKQPTHILTLIVHKYSSVLLVPLVLLLIIAII
jgi:hypothetical protein